MTCKAFLLACLLCVACASSDESKSVNFSLTAKQNYEKGLAELKDENYPEALRYFNYVKQKFPFSKYAPLAELAVADTQFERETYQEAIDSYKSFIRLRPKHEKVSDGYASFRIAECYVKEMPDDWVIMPPSYEKDQAAVFDALRELNNVLERFPESTYAKDAREYRKKVLHRLIDHEVFVARFYLGQGHPKGAVLRISEALRRYPDSGRDAELLLTLGETQLEMGNPASAKQTFQRITPDMASAIELRRAGLFLDFIKKRYGDEPKDTPPTPPAQG
jgi:outer membrane protein assembly factor BamD